MRISDWSSDVCSSDLLLSEYREYERGTTACVNASVQPVLHRYIERLNGELKGKGFRRDLLVMQGNGGTIAAGIVSEAAVNTVMSGPRSEEHTSELQSLMRTSYAVFCLKKNK